MVLKDKDDNLLIFKECDQWKRTQFSKNIGRIFRGKMKRTQEENWTIT
jgi:hypothetical protein